MPLTKTELELFINSTARSTVKISVRNLIDIYEDNWRHIIRQELASQFTDKSYQKLKPLITQELNLIKRAVNERSFTYKNKATRKAVTETETKDDEGNKTIKETPDETYEDIVKRINFDNIMKQVETFTELSNHVILKVVWRDNKLDYDVLTFDNVEIFTDPEDWKKIVAIKYFINLKLPNFDITDQNFKVKDQIQTQLREDRDFPIEDFLFSFLWTVEDNGETGRVFKFKQENGKEKLVSEEPNPYKDEEGKVVLPFILFSKQQPIGRLLNFSNGNDLFDANINLAINLIHLNELIKYQSYKQIVFKTKNLKNLPDKMEFDPQSMITLKVDEDGIGDITTLDLQTEIQRLWDIIKNRAIMILSAYGISPQNFTMSAIPASGFALELDNRQLLEDRQNKLSVLREKEDETFKKTRIVWNFHNPNKPIDIKSMFKMDFGEIDFPKSEQDLATEKTVKIKNSVETPIDWIMQENPDLTREEAEKVFQENKAINQTNGRGVAIQPTQQPGSQEDENAT